MSAGYNANCRVAFDPNFGRAWMVCPRCGYWALLPLEERWEVSASCEERFARAAARVTLGNISQAETANGDVLIRLGDTPYADVARYRYLDSALASDGRNFRRILFKVAIVFGVNAALLFLAASSLVGVVLRALPQLWTAPTQLILTAAVGAVNVALIRLSSSRLLAARLRRRFMTIGSDDGPATMRWSHIRLLKVCSSNQDRSWSLRITHEMGESEFQGAAAELYLGVILSRLPHPVYTQHDLNGALLLIKTRGGASAFLESFALGRKDGSDCGVATCVGLMQSPGG